MASNKNDGPRPKRSYTLRARARRREEVHRRITLATVFLHGTKGPARTTVSDVAKIAGVRRATVYNHFPTDRELLDACSSHWFSENPPPDPGPWTAIADPGERTLAALRGMYAYYDHGRDMLEKVLRDAPLVPALDEIVRQKWVPLMEGIVEMLAAGRDGDSRMRATLHAVVDFGTWRKLREGGLSNDEAAGLAAMWAEAVRGE